MLAGIVLLGKRRSVRGFSDNSGMYITNPSDIPIIESVYSKVRRVFGLILHTDPAKCKNPLVPWGRHKHIKSEWPSWVTVKNECTFLGFPVSNQESPEVTTQKLLKSLTQVEFNI